jgi:RimJ/RimL family protein N-acetyltransferase
MRKAGGSWYPGSAAIGLFEDGELVAGVVFDSYNRASVCMHVAAVEGKRWMSRPYLQGCFAYAFRQLGVKKILGLVPADNTEARAFDEHLGFVLEATLKDAHPNGDLLIYSMTPDQCRWLHLKVSPWVVHSENQAHLLPPTTQG